MLTGVSVVMNTLYAIQHKGNAAVTVVAGGFLFVALALIGGITGRYDVARALAVVFLLSSALTHGIPLIESATKITANAHTNPTIDPTTHTANGQTWTGSPVPGRGVGM